MYAKISGSNIDVCERPNWFNSDGSAVTDSYLASEGIYVLIDNKPTITKYQKYSIDDTSKWTVNNTNKSVTTTYIISNLSLDELKSIKLDELEGTISNTFNDGFQWYFYDDINENKVFQTREQDLINILSKHQQSMIAINSNNGNSLTEFIMKDNSKVEVSFIQLNSALTSLLNWRENIILNIRAKKDSIINATTIEELDLIDLNLL